MQRGVFVEWLRSTSPGTTAHASHLPDPDAAHALEQAVRWMRHDLAASAEDETWLERCRTLVENLASVADLLPTESGAAPLPLAAEAAPALSGRQMLAAEDQAAEDQATEACVSEDQADENQTSKIQATLETIAPPPQRATGRRNTLWIAVAALIPVIALAAWWHSQETKPDEPAAPPTVAPVVPPEVQAVVADSLPAPLDCADLPLLALELSDPGVLDDLPMLIWLAEEAAPDNITTAAASETEPVTTVPEWPQLSPEQRRLLNNWAALWPRLPGDARRQLADNATLWLALDDTQRHALAEKVDAWDAQSASTRLSPRERFEAWRQIGSEGRALVRASAHWLAMQPGKQQQQWMLQFSALPPQQQAVFLRDAATRDVYESADAAFPFVPETSRGETIALVRGLAPSQRAQLREATRRMNPQQRETLRRKLLALPPAQRADAI